MTTGQHFDRGRRVALAVVAATVALQLAWLLPTVPLLEPDEGRYLDIPRHMVESGDWVTPRLNGVLYFEKPPLHYWLTAAAIQVFGVHEIAVRIWNALFALLGVAIVWRVAHLQAGRDGGLAAALVLGTSPLWIGLGRLGSLDMAVSFFITVTLACVWLAVRSNGGRCERWLWWGAFASAAAAVLTKGLIGIVIPAAVAGAWVVTTRQWHLLRRVPWVSGVLLFVAVAAPWHVVVSLRNPDFAWFYFVHEHVLRYATPVAARQEPWWFFVAVIALGMLPWTGLLPESLRVTPGLGRSDELAKRRDGLFFAVWFAVVFLFFSASHSKLIPYMGPALPPLAVLVGRTLGSSWHAAAAPRLLRVGWVCGAGLLAAVGAGLVIGGTGKIARLGLGGHCTPWLVAAGIAATGMAVAGAVAGWRSRWPRACWLTAMAAVVVNLSLGGLALRLGEERSSKGTAMALRPLLEPGEPVFAYRDFQESLAPYLDREVGIVGAVGELAFGVSHLSEAERLERFPTVEEFRPRWDSSKRIWLSVGRNWRRKLAADRLGHVEVVWEGRERALVTNIPLKEGGEGEGTGDDGGA